MATLAARVTALAQAVAADIKALTTAVAARLPLAGGTLSGAINEATPVTLASAATVNIGAAAANTLNISGTNTITAFDTIAAGARRTLRFNAGLTLTYDATKLILPRAANITTVAGDVADFVSLGGGNWACIGYERANAASAKGDLGLVKGDVGLSNVDNTSDANKSISTAAQSALDAKAPLASPTFSNTARIYGPSGEPRFILDGPAGLNKYFTFYTAGVQRFQFGMSSAAESGNNAGSNFYINRFGDNGTVIGNTLTVDRASGDIVLWGKTQSTGPMRPGQYTLSTLPSASANSGYEIDVTDAAGGAKRCRSNGTNWIILNTTTTVS